jgi:hypothetical protein
LKSDELNAFCTDSDAFLEGAAAGPLAGLDFAAKDIFDVAGHVTGGGNPDWKRSHGPASKTAWAVQILVDAGATMVGKTQRLGRGSGGQAGRLRPGFGHRRLGPGTGLILWDLRNAPYARPDLPGRRHAQRAVL